MAADIFSSSPFFQTPCFFSIEEDATSLLAKVFCLPEFSGSTLNVCAGSSSIWLPCGHPIFPLSRLLVVREQGPRSPLLGSLLGSLIAAAVNWGQLLKHPRSF